MSIAMFRKDDTGYVAWLAANSDGFVVNSNIPPNAGYLVLHRASCPTISRLQPQARSWTAEYQKTCSTSLAELRRWAMTEIGGTGSPCSLCKAPAD